MKVFKKILCFVSVISVLISVFAFVCSADTGISDGPIFYANSSDVIVPLDFTYSARTSGLGNSSDTSFSHFYSNSPNKLVASLTDSGYTINEPNIYNDILVDEDFIVDYTPKMIYYFSDLHDITGSGDTIYEYILSPMIYGRDVYSCMTGSYDKYDLSENLINHWNYNVDGYGNSNLDSTLLVSDGSFMNRCQFYSNIPFDSYNYNAYAYPTYLTLYTMFNSENRNLLADGSLDLSGVDPSYYKITAIINFDYISADEEGINERRSFSGYYTFNPNFSSVGDDWRLAGVNMAYHYLFGVAFAGLQIDLLELYDYISSCVDDYYIITELNVDFIHTTTFTDKTVLPLYSGIPSELAYQAGSSITDNRYHSYVPCLAYKFYYEEVALDDRPVTDAYYQLYDFVEFYSVVNNEYVTLENFNLFSWLGNTIGSVLNVQLIGPITLGSVLYLVLGIGFLYVVIKFFAGG